MSAADNTKCDICGNNHHPMAECRDALRSLASAAGSSVWNPLDDEFEEILGGSWAVIRTADGWEIECQHSQTTLPLKSTDMESAKIEGRKLARQFERRYLTNAEPSRSDQPPSTP